MKKNNELITVEDVKKVLGLHITLKHTGKMKGMQSLSTSCLCNKYCKSYASDSSKVCSHCYAQTQMKMYSNMQQCFERNTKILTKSIIDKKYLPIINAAFFRFEAFGDLNNIIQVINYFNVCKRNKKVKFALWTKNPSLIDIAIKNGNSKPNNLQIILSSHYLNMPASNDQYDFVDKIFTVYDKKYIDENKININCGAKSCLLCHKCYVKNKEIYINEKLK